MMRALMVVVTAVVVAGCVSAKVEQIRTTPGKAVPLAAGDSVVILSRRQHGDRQTEESFNRCLESKLTRADMPVIAESVFVDALYPWLEPRLAPVSAKALPRLLDQPGVSERIRAARVRYMIWVDGKSETVDSNGALSCAAAPGFAGCFGFGMWDKLSDYEAEIWDLNSGEALGKVSARATGTSYVPAVIIPVPIIAPTQSAACDGVAEQLADLIRPG
jgi:hypothetical protein